MQSNKRQKGDGDENQQTNKRIKQQSSIVSFFASTSKNTDKKADESYKEDFPNSSFIDNSQESKNIINNKENETVKDNEIDTFTTSMYTDEFDNMLDIVLKGESYLFNKDELSLFDTYKSLKDESRHLIVRLLMRKHGWIRKSRLNYSNQVNDVNAATADLKSKGFILTSLEDLSEAVKILSKEEMKLIIKERNIRVLKKNSLKKEDYEKEIINFGLNVTGNIVTHYSNLTTDSIKAKKLWESIHSFLGDCIKVNPKIFTLFQRLQIVYYRINSFQDKSYMSSSILARISKRNYPSYKSCRSNAIWNSRDDLLKYEDALLVEKEFYNHLEQLSIYNSTRTKKNISTKGEDPIIRDLMVKSWTLCEDRIGIWEDCITESSLQERSYYLRRFEAGWIYTRLLDHGTELLAKLFEYELESLILQKLLDQRIYRLGKRGKWYERLALVQSIYLNKNQPRFQKKVALKTCIDAIQDPSVHQIYLHELHKRIKRLEKDLCIPKREQHDFSYMSLKKPKEITIYGERISEQVTGKKSIWRSNDGSECSVEQIAIEYYQKKGYKGIHCENGIIRMIAVLLFWDIIFAPIAGVFETPYQTEPLDLRTDSFYESRIDIINKRLREIEDGDYLRIITEVDKRERLKHTVCIGINWNYEFQDIIEIAECIGPSSLASLCKLFFEEFGQRQGGMPDLCCWNYDKKECLFSEVKGPKDVLSKTQKIWIETLTGFGIQVEVCHVKIWNGEDVFLKDS
ncbi:VRR-NUC domain-containing protein [Cokeromyces recurvatus]|uniref:VRR-NUC domain-containing protein n=1 Tax=Cokeromyces recurvatus TaxID=90255 RepID=UPI00221EB140|nr:VRR-NUC domain-containing protein [Cokeromyces recurvatus]KAI7901977.1 VRR-NUC domain-containing protein [Cokeromyces recurvatus]